MIYICINRFLKKLIPKRRSIGFGTPKGMVLPKIHFFRNFGFLLRHYKYNE